MLNRQLPMLAVDTSCHVGSPLTVNSHVRRGQEAQAQPAVLQEPGGVLCQARPRHEAPGRQAQRALQRRRPQAALMRLSSSCQRRMQRRPPSGQPCSSLRHASRRLTWSSRARMPGGMPLLGRSGGGEFLECSSALAAVTVAGSPRSSSCRRSAQPTGSVPYS